MRILPALTATVLFSVALGCQDESARQSQQATADFQTALAMFQSAESGFIPQDDLKGQKLMDVSLAEHRQQQLAAARAALAPVIESGTPAQQAAALRLEAAVHQSAASHQARQAVSRWADLSSQSVNLLNLMLAIDGADAQVHKFSVDSGPVLTTIKNDQTATQDEVAQMQKTAGALRGKIDEMDKQRATAQTASETAAAEARKLRTDAFTRKGDEQYAMYDQATAADRRSSQHSVQAQTLAEQIGVLRAELGIIDSKIKTAQETLTNLQKSIQRTADRDASTRQAADAAKQDKQTNAQALIDQLTQMSKAFEEEVHQPMAEAEKKAQMAVDAASNALTKTPASEQRDCRLDLLTRHAALAHVMASHVIVNGDWNELLQTISTMANQKRGDEALLADKVSFFQTNAAQAQTRQRELSGQAKAAINDGLTLAAEITSGSDASDPLTATANAIADRLQGYSKQLSTP